MRTMTIPFHDVQDGIKATLYNEGSLVCVSEDNGSDEEGLLSLGFDNLRRLDGTSINEAFSRRAN